jgi:hypothetical protein
VLIAEASDVIFSREFFLPSVAIFLHRDARTTAFVVMNERHSVSRDKTV